MSQTTSRPRKPPTTTPVAPKIHDAHLVDEMDELLDEIDEVLEENVIETLRAYRQKGGQ